MARFTQTEARDETEGTLGCLWERDDEEVSCSGVLDPLGGDISSGPCKSRRHSWKSASTEMEDCLLDQKAGCPIPADL